MQMRLRSLFRHFTIRYERLCYKSIRLFGELRDCVSDQADDEYVGRQRSTSVSISRDLDDCNYSIKFIPKEMGVHTVSVKHKDMHIPGSPFGE